jgi:hypothetical protein
MRRFRISELVAGFLLGFATLLVIFILSSDIAAQHEVCETTKEGAKECASYGVVHFALHEIGAALDSYNGLITALATAFIAWFTLSLRRSTDKLWDAGERQTNIARQAMIAGERAFVFATGVSPYYEMDDTGLYHWRFRPTWKNSGDTPTKNMVMHTACALRTEPLPQGFDFACATTETGTALIPPNTDIGGGLAPRMQSPAISPQDILDVQAGNKLLYLWGWAKYRDVFPDTPEHITRFCFRVLPGGNPLIYAPGIIAPQPGSLTFPTIHHTEGNCADDECH